MVTSDVSHKNTNMISKLTRSSPRKFDEPKGGPFDYWLLIHCCGIDRHGDDSFDLLTSGGFSCVALFFPSCSSLPVNVSWLKQSQVQMTETAEGQKGDWNLHEALSAPWMMVFFFSCLLVYCLSPLSLFLCDGSLIHSLFSTVSVFIHNLFIFQIKGGKSQVNHYKNNL